MAFANIVRGVPMNARHVVTGNLLDPCALLGGLATLARFALHGPSLLPPRRPAGSPPAGPPAAGPPAAAPSPSGL